MRKSSLYLPDRLKAALAARAAATGTSEAELIRNALQASLAQPITSSVYEQAFGADRDPPVPGRFVGVGVGPGEADLLTLRGLRAIRRADRVMAPTTAVDAVGRAESVVRQVAPDARVERVSFTMQSAERARKRSLQLAAAAVTARLEEGEEVAWVTLGDPLTYSTFAAVAELVRAKRPSTVVNQVPGIMAFQALASRTGTVIASADDRLVVRTASEGIEVSADLAHPDATVVVYKGGRSLPELAQAAARAGRDGKAVAGELLGLPGERVGTLSELAAAGPASYLATVIVPAASDGPRARRAR